MTIARGLHDQLATVHCMLAQDELEPACFLAELKESRAKHRDIIKQDRSKQEQKEQEQYDDDELSTDIGEDDDVISITDSEHEHNINDVELSCFVQRQLKAIWTIPNFEYVALTKFMAFSGSAASVCTLISCVVEVIAQILTEHLRNQFLDILDSSRY